MYTSQVILKSDAVYINNHTQIWGSWYSVQTRQWGYACCHSLIHASYCTGQAGIEAADASSHATLLKIDQARLENQRREEDAAATATTAVSTSKRLGEGDLQLDQEKLAHAMREERKRKAGDLEERYGNDKKRKYNGGMDVDVTEEELGEISISVVSSKLHINQYTEAYRMNRQVGTEDPMYNYKDEE